MASRYPLFDRSELRLDPLSRRTHDLDRTCILPLEQRIDAPETVRAVARRVFEARGRGASVVLFMGAHVIRSGVQRYLIDLMERGFLSCLAGNGACLIHDFELAMAGATTESVARYIKDGRFGMWTETSMVNEVAKLAAGEEMGVGEAAARFMAERDFPHRETSLFCRAFELGVPFTVHVAMGQDIVHEHPNCDGAAWGRASYTDFLILTRVMQGLQGGAVLSFGSAVMAPEVYLKALSMVRNVAAQSGKTITDLHTLVTDLRELPERVDVEAPKSDPAYYFRPYKTMLVRTVADGGQGHYLRARHADAIPWLWTELMKLEDTHG